MICNILVTWKLQLAVCEQEELPFSGFPWTILCFSVDKVHNVIWLYYSQNPLIYLSIMTHICDTGFTSAPIMQLINLVITLFLLLQVSHYCVTFEASGMVEVAPYKSQNFFHMLICVRLLIIILQPSSLKICVGNRRARTLPMKYKVY